jgi:DNA-binding CsgD family transcriptional regulator
MEVEMSNPFSNWTPAQVARNKDFKSIGNQFGMSPSGVGQRMTRIYDRLGFRGTVALTHWAIQNKVVKLGDFEK